jgi:hypothetical protein
MHWLVSRVLWNPETRRPRLPWRLGLGVIVLALVSLLVTLGVRYALDTGVGGVVGLQLQSAGGGFVASVLSMVVLTVSTLAGVYLAGRLVDRRRFADFGFHLDGDWWADFAAGAGSGVVLMTAIFLVEWAAGWVRVTDTFVSAPGQSFLVAFLLSVVFFVGVSITEELLTRGYLLTNVAEGLAGFGPVAPPAAVGIATLATATLFGLGHANNPNATLVSTVALGLAGVFLAVGYVLTGELGFPVGLHLTWNLFQGNVYGFPVSGTGTGATVLAVSQRGPRWVTGGPFGPEAGLLGVVAMLVGIALTVAWVRRREGRVALAAAVWRPDLRWRDARDVETSAPERADRRERDEVFEAGDGE